jgi:serine/threonine protein kinase
MECCRESLYEIIKLLTNEIKEENSEMTKTLCYYICCELLTEIIEFIYYLHERNAIHRDLKPANILITDGINGRFLKLGDFGLSVIHEFNDESHTRFSETLNYMSTNLFSLRNDKKLSNE